MGAAISLPGGGKSPGPPFSLLNAPLLVGRDGSFSFLLGFHGYLPGWNGQECLVTAPHVTCTATTWEEVASFLLVGVVNPDFPPGLLSEEGEGFFIMAGWR